MDAVVLQKIFSNPPSETACSDISTLLCDEITTFSRLQDRARLSSIVAASLSIAGSACLYATSPVLFAVASFPGVVVIAIVSRAAFSYYEEWRNNQEQRIKSLELGSAWKLPEGPRPLSIASPSSSSEDAQELLPIGEHVPQEERSLEEGKAKEKLPEKILNTLDAIYTITSEDNLADALYELTKSPLVIPSNENYKVLIAQREASLITIFKRQFNEAEIALKQALENPEFTKLEVNQKRFCALRIVQHICATSAAEYDRLVEDAALAKASLNWIPPDYVLEDPQAQIDLELTQIFFLKTMKVATVVAYVALALVALTLVNAYAPTYVLESAAVLMSAPFLFQGTDWVSRKIAALDKSIDRLTHFKMCQELEWIPEAREGGDHAGESFNLEKFKDFLINLQSGRTHNSHVLSSSSQDRFLIQNTHLTSITSLPKDGLIHDSSSNSLFQIEDETDSVGVDAPNLPPKLAATTASMSNSKSGTPQPSFMDQAGSYIFNNFIARKILPKFLPSIRDLSKIDLDTSIPEQIIADVLKGPNLSHLTERQKYFWALKVAEHIFIHANNDNSTVVDLKSNLKKNYDKYHQYVNSLISYQTFAGEAENLAAALSSGIEEAKKHKDAFLATLIHLNSTTERAYQDTYLDNPDFNACTQKLKNITDSLQPNPLDQPLPVPVLQQQQQRIQTVVKTFSKAGRLEDSTIMLREALTELANTPLIQCMHQVAGENNHQGFSYVHLFEIPAFQRELKTAYTALLAAALQNEADLNARSLERIADLIREHSRLFAEVVHAREAKSKLDDHRQITLDGINQSFFERVNNRLQLLQFIQPEMRKWTVAPQLNYEVELGYIFADWDKSTSRLKGSVAEIRSLLMDQNPTNYKPSDYAAPFLGLGKNQTSATYGVLLNDETGIYSSNSYLFPAVLSQPKQMDEILFKLMNPPRHSTEK